MLKGDQVFPRWCSPVTLCSNRYFFTFEFQRNPDTWDPTAVFIDDRTQRPPANLKDNSEETGFKTIQYLPGVDFNEVIGTLLQLLQAYTQLNALLIEQLSRQQGPLPLNL